MEIWTGGETSPAELEPPDRPHLLGWRELNRLDAELSLDRLPGVLGPDFDADVLTLLLLELGVEVDAGVPGDISSLVAPLDFRLDFLLETLLRLSISESRMG